MTAIGISRKVAMSYDNAITKVTEELSREGFGVLTFIDLRETLKKKLGVDFPRHAILGACNPTFAYAALQKNSDMGLLLPCNVVVRENEGGVEISAFDPQSAVEALALPGIAELAGEVRARLERVIAAV